MAQYDVEVEQLIRQRINATVTADNPEEAITKAADPTNWADWDAPGDEDIIENRPLTAEEVEE